MTRPARRTPAPLLPQARCTARSKRTGEPCKNPPMLGQRTCRMHGGATKAARAKAEERLLASADRLMAQLLHIAFSGESEANRLAATRDALDRAGLGAKYKVEIEATWETIIHGIVSEVPDEYAAPLPARYRPVDPDIIAGEVVDSHYEEPGNEIHIVEGGEVFDWNTGTRLSPSRLAKAAAADQPPTIGPQTDD